jgi:hypothetical protein
VSLNEGRWVWTLTAEDATAYPLVGGYIQPRLLRRFYRAPSQGEIVVPANNVFVTRHFFSLPNEPRQTGWQGLWRNPADGLFSGWELRFDLLQALAGAEAFFLVQRVDSIGNFVQNVTAESGSLSLGTTGPKVVGLGAGQPQTSPQFGDRVSLRVRARRNSKSVGTVILSLGDPEADVLESPLEMANPLIVWNGNSLPFPRGASEYLFLRRADRVLNFSQGGVAASSLRALYDEISVGVDNFTDEQFERDLRAWWSWAARGLAYSFALDSAETASAVMNIASIPTSVRIPDTAAFAVGKYYVARRITGEYEDVFYVDNKTSNALNLGSSQALRNSYFPGDLVRSLDFFPKVVSLDDSYPVRRHITTWGFAHRMREDQG